VDGSVASFREALRLRPEAAQVHVMLGHTLSTAGDLAGAVACQRRAIEINPASPGAYGGLLTTLGGKAADEELQRAEELLRLSWMTDERCATLHSGLAHAYDGRGDWDRAAEHMLRANEQKKKYLEERDLGYDPAEHSATWTASSRRSPRNSSSASAAWAFPASAPCYRGHAALQYNPHRADPGQPPVRVRRRTALRLPIPGPAALRPRPAGQPAHIDGPALEKLANWHLERLHKIDGGGAERIVDKMPDNYQMLRWLAAVFPRARFIHCRRDVRDVALYQARYFCCGGRRLLVLDE
jgi:tetratricopeptide (TPR) repeat protein